MRIVDSVSQNQVIGNSIDDKIRNTVENVVLSVENGMHGAILTAMDNVVVPRVEMAVRLITGSSEQGPSSVVQKPQSKEFHKEYYQHPAHVGLKPLRFK